MVILHAHVNLGSISLSDGPQDIGLLSAWLSYTGYRHTCTVPQALGNMEKLLHCSAISPTSSGASICFSCSLSNSSQMAAAGNMLCTSEESGMVYMILILWNKSVFKASNSSTSIAIFFVLFVLTYLSVSVPCLAIK